jgi:hypothetical protein
MVERLEVRQMMDAAGLIRTIDGSGNNLVNPTWGSDGVDLVRLSPAAYGDGISSLAGANRPSARAISNAVSDEGDQDILSSQHLSAMVYAWGQFIDHDMDLTPTGATESLSITVPKGDPSFDLLGTGTQVIPTTRSIFDSKTGTSTSNPRQQINTITAWLDGSMIYGSDAATAAALRTMSGGLLKTSAGNLLPLNTGLPVPGGLLNMANDSQLVPETQLFAAGDVRANENIELTALQTLFVREHNFWAAKIAAGNSKLTDEQIYQQARSIVIGEIEAITYNQWLPAVLGPNAVSAYRGYNASVNPGIADEFSTAAFRFGHSLLADDIEFFDNNGNPVRDEVELAQAFFNPDLMKQSGVDPLLKYLSSSTASELDTKVVSSVRNFLFGPPGSGGLDLASLNIERGRDNGLADYNTVRVAYHLPKVTSFAQITSDVALQQQLKSLYGSVNNIDLWVGALAENHLPGASVGPTLKVIISDQFQRLRDGDRLWYERDFAGTRMLDQIQHTTLADIIERNSTITNLQDNVFFMRAQVQGQVFADVNGDGRTSRGEIGLAGISLDLLNSDGELIGSTTTDRNGFYRFGFSETGNYQVRVTLPTGAVLAATTNPVNVSVTRGDRLVGGINFGLKGIIKSAPTCSSSTTDPTTAATDQLLTDWAAATPSRPKTHVIRP